jgi:ubiquinone/menaquinone biosynthesis C-methylase UbiE
MNPLLRKLTWMDPHVCPWWVAYTFDNPLRRLVHRPERIFEGLIPEGAIVLDIGCGMGFFTLAMAAMVGDGGHVFALDIQKEMLAQVRRRASRKGLSHRITTILCEANHLSVDAQADFGLAFWMVHEVPDQNSFFRQVQGLLKPDGRLLLVEPLGHVSAARFGKILELASTEGFHCRGERQVWLSRTALLQPTRAHSRS